MKMVHATSLDSVRIDVLGEGRGLTVPCSLILEWNEAHRQDTEPDQQRAIEVMKRYGCYVVPTYEFCGKYIHSPRQWRLRDKDGHDFPLAWLLELDNQGAFPTPEAALVAAGEYLDAQGKERGE